LFILHHEDRLSSRSIHSWMYSGQCTISIPSASHRIKKRIAARSTRFNSSKSSRGRDTQASICARKSGSCSDSTRPLIRKVVVSPSDRFSIRNIVICSLHRLSVPRSLMIKFGEWTLLVAAVAHQALNVAYEFVVLGELDFHSRQFPPKYGTGQRALDFSLPHFP
jgi:hypothetical protein